MNRKLKRARGLIPLLSDGKLTNDEKKLVDEVIRSHPELKDEVSKFDRLMKITGGIEDEPVPALIEERILKRVKSRDEEGGISRRFFEYITGSPRKLQLEVFGAVAVAVLVLVVFIRLFPKTEFSPDVAFAPEGTREEVIGSTAPGSLVTETPETTLEIPLEDYDMAPSVPGTASEEPEGKIPPSLSEKKSQPMMIEGGIVFSEDEKNEKALSVKRSFNGVSKKDIETAGGEGPGISLEPVMEGEKLKKTTLVLVGDDKRVLPVSLTIYTTDPYKTEMEIINKAIELGGEIKGYVDTSTTHYDKGDALTKEEMEDIQTIYLTHEMIQELLDYIESNYRPTEPDIEELDFSEKEVLLNIDFSPPQPDD
jgi:hypothetical protein